MSVALNNAFLAYHTSREDVDGLKNKMGKFGDKWVGVRFEFLKATASSVVDTVYNVATAIFNTLWSLTAGLAFSNKELRDGCLSSWSSVVGNVGDVAKSIVGVVCPYLVDRFFHECPETAPASAV